MGLIVSVPGHCLSVYLLLYHAAFTNKIVVVLMFYGPSTLFRSFQARTVNLSTLSLGKHPRQFTSTLFTFFRQ